MSLKGCKPGFSLSFELILGNELEDELVVLDVRVERSPAVLGAVRRLIQCARRALERYGVCGYTSRSVVAWHADGAGAGRAPYAHALVECGDKQLLITYLGGVQQQALHGVQAAIDMHRGLAPRARYAVCSGPDVLVWVDQRLLEEPASVYRREDGSYVEEYNVCGLTLSVAGPVEAEGGCTLEHWVFRVADLVEGGAPDPASELLEFEALLQDSGRQVAVVTLLDARAAAVAEDLLLRGHSGWGLAATLTCQVKGMAHTIVGFGCRSGGHTCSLSVRIPTYYSAGHLGFHGLATRYLVFLHDILECVKRFAESAGAALGGNPLLRWVRV